MRCKDYKLAVDLFQCPLPSVRPLYSLQGITLGIIIRDPVTNNQQQANIPLFGSGGYDINGLLFVINFFLESLHNALTGDNRPPYIYFQPENRLFYLVVPEIYFNNPSNPIQIIFNEDLYNLFSGFPVLPTQISGQTWYSISYFSADDGYGYQPPVTNVNFRGRWPASGYARRIVAECPTDYRFNQLQAVIVTSNIPIRQETLPLATD
jgi:hypothetical protein